MSKPVVLDTPLVAQSRETPAGATHVLSTDHVIGGFAVPAKSTVYTLKDGSLDEIVIKAAVVAGGTKVKKTARIADDRGRWLLSGENGTKLVQGGLTIAAGAPVRVAPDGTVLVAFPLKAGKLRGEPYSEGTRLDWVDGAWVVEVEGDYVPEPDVEEEDDDEDFLDEADDD